MVWIMLPKCSLCLMAYMSIFSAFGVGELMRHPNSLTAIKILLAVIVTISIALAVKSKQYIYAATSLCCTIMFIVNKEYFQSTLINIITSLALIMAALQVRLMKVRKRECLFEQQGNVVC